MSRQVIQNWRTLESGGRVSCAWLSSHMDRLYRVLIRSAEFHSMVQQTEDREAANKPNHWMPLLEHDNCRSGLLYLPPWGRIAMHDHQQSIGVSIVLDGEGVTEDSVEALEWIFKAAQANHPKATRVFNYLMANPVGLDC